MKCETFENYLDGYLDGSLSELEQQAYNYWRNSKATLTVDIMCSAFSMMILRN